MASSLCTSRQRERYCTLIIHHNNPIFWGINGLATHGFTLCPMRLQTRGTAAGARYFFPFAPESCLLASSASSVTTPVIAERATSTFTWVAICNCTVPSLKPATVP